MEIVTHLVVYFVGLATGMYAASQIESHIDNRTNGKKRK